MTPMIELAKPKAEAWSDSMTPLQLTKALMSQPSAASVPSTFDSSRLILSIVRIEAAISPTAPVIGSRNRGSRDSSTGLSDSSAGLRDSSADGVVAVMG